MNLQLFASINYDDLTNLGIATGLGLLVGLQREHADHKIGGVRTFTIIAILGAVAGLLTRQIDNPFIIPVLTVALVAVLIMANIVQMNKTDIVSVGQTTEVAAILMFITSAYLINGDRLTAVIVGAGLALLLYAKEVMHDFIDKLKDKDISAIMTFAAISLIILPILPDRTFGPLNVLNPRNIWLMVTLIVGLSVVGYFVYKFVNNKVGILTNAILGGMISSTATAVSFARKTKNNAAPSKVAAFIIIVASAISIGRVMVEVAVVAPQQFVTVLLPLAAELVFIAILSIFIFFTLPKKETEEKMPEPKNPAQLKSALIFGILYGVVLLVVAFFKKEFGNQALYPVAFLSGLTDVDAITLSLSNLMNSGSLEATAGWKLLMVAILSNMSFKAVIAISLGTKQLTKWMIIVFGICIAFGLLLIWIWPVAWLLSA